MNIILLGYRGTGKSVISRLLSKQLKRRLVQSGLYDRRSGGHPNSGNCQYVGMDPVP